MPVGGNFISIPIKQHGYRLKMVDINVALAGVPQAGRVQAVIRSKGQQVFGSVISTSLWGYGGVTAFCDFPLDFDDDVFFACYYSTNNAILYAKIVIEKAD